LAYTPAKQKAVNLWALSTRFDGNEFSFYYEYEPVYAISDLCGEWEIWLSSGTFRDIRL